MMSNLDQSSTDVAPAPTSEDTGTYEVRSGPAAEAQRPASGDSRPSLFPGDIVLEGGQVESIRRALIAGLHCHGEVQRLFARAVRLRSEGVDFDSDSVPWCTPGDRTNVATREFAAALSFLERMD